MKILHVAPHLGGGVGKAHAAISAVLPEVVQQTFLLLETPRERRYIERIEAAGARVIVANDLDHVATLARDSDLVQFEFWNHPRLFECLARAQFPPLRSVFWSHISGLYRPLVPPGLLHMAGRFVFSTAASMPLAKAAGIDPREVAVINSGFGFAEAPPRDAAPRNPSIAYLGTVDFVKMHPGFFDAIDALSDREARVSVWGGVDPHGEVAARARGMRHPERILFRGQTADPAAALAEADIFFYPLQREHYGTAENALIEAMSLGLTCVVLDNPAEQAIIRDGDTGFVATSIDDCVSLLDLLLLLPELRAKIGRNAFRHVAETHAPAQAAQDFMILWLGLLSEEPRLCDFRSAIGENPADWFLATQRATGAAWQPSPPLVPEKAAKGTLAHFESVFAGDASFARLRA